MNPLINVARHVPINEATVTLSINPVTLPAPGRGLPLELRITAPANGRGLPIILLSHGGGTSNYLSSKDGYGPLVDFLAAHGFAVIQPTHLSSKVGGFGLNPSAPGFSLFWRSRIADMKLILDSLEEIEAQVPTIARRLDPSKVAVVGHSGGSQTAGMLLGARLFDSRGEGVMDSNVIEPRIKAGVLLAPLGQGGDHLTAPIREKYPELNPDFSHLTTPTLVVYGDDDLNPMLTARGADWHADPYHLSPGANGLLTLSGAKHFLGGIMGYDARESDDEDPDRLAITQRMTWAYLRSALDEGDSSWRDACRALREHAGSLGRVETK